MKKKKVINCNRLVLFADIRGDNNTEKLSLSSSKDYLKKCINCVGYNKVFKFRHNNRNLYVEFLDASKFTGDFIIGKLTSSEDSTNFQFRSKTSNEIKEIIDDPDKDFESKTFFVISLDNLVIFSVFTISSPRINCLSDMLYSISVQQENISKVPQKVMSNITTIGCKNMIKELSNSQSVSEIITYEKPKMLDTIDRSETGLSEKEYEFLRNKTHIVETRKISSEKKGEDIFEEGTTSEQKESFFKKIFGNTQYPEKNTVRYKKDESTSFERAKILNNPLIFSFSVEVNDYIENENTFDYDIKKYDDRVVSAMINQYNLHKESIAENYEDLD